MNPTVTAIALAVFTAILGLVGALYVQALRDKKQLIQKNADKIEEMSSSLKVLQTQISPLWAQVQTRIAEELHHPNPRYAEMDILLEKLEKMSITTTERIRLRVLLYERSVDMHPDITDAQRASSILMLGIMEKVLEEKTIETNTIRAMIQERILTRLQEAVRVEEPALRVDITPGEQLVVEAKPSHEEGK